LARYASAQCLHTASIISRMQNAVVQVDATLRAVGMPNIFAAGDVASLPSPRPKAGVFAVKSGPPLAANLRRVLVGDDDNLERYDPQTTFLGVIGTGRPECAVASKSTCAITAGWVWDLRDWIDRKWMAG
jgi:selenide,water dikinase